MSRIDLLRPHANVLVFDDYLSGTTPRFSLPEFDDMLARPEQCELVLFASETAGSTPSLEYALYTGPDDLNWLELGSDSIALTVAGQDFHSNTQSVVRGEYYQQLRSGFMRLRFALTESGASTRLRVWFTDRDEGI